MEPKQFEKLEQWFKQLNVEVTEIKTTMATKQLLESKFQHLFVAMDSLLKRFLNLQETLGHQNSEVTILKLAIKKLEEDFEKLRAAIH